MKKTDSIGRSDSDLRPKAGLKKITIDASVRDTAIAKQYEAYGLEKGVPVEHVDGVPDGFHEGHTLATGKKEVLVTAFQGAAIKECTGLEDKYVCCNLHVVNQTTNCPLDCSYCILQAYLNKPVTTVHANIDQMLEQIRTEAATQPNRLFRVGTGDLGDALALDPLGSATAELVPRFAEISNVLLELKTKSAEVDQLLTLEHRGRVAIAWSVNSATITDTEEHRCASLNQRLEAAKRVVEAGYLLAFHFDPMVVHDGWEEHYPATMRQIAEAIPLERVAWISMGALRFPPHMLKTMQQRFPNSRLPLGELFIASDGKMRYMKPARIAMYNALNESIDDVGGHDVFRYLCMETPEVWRRVFGFVPATNADLDFRFASSICEKFPYMMTEAPDFEYYRQHPNLGLESAVDSSETVRLTAG